MALAAWAIAMAMPAGAVQRVETLALGAPPVAAWNDAAGGKLFVATELPGRGRGLAVLERNGRLTTVPLASAPAALAGASAQRKLLIAHAGGGATVVHLDSLEATPIALPASAVVRAVVAERTARGYILGRTARDATLASIDLRTLATRVATLDDGLPIDMALDAAGNRLFVLLAADRPGEPAASVVRVLDAQTLEPIAPPTRLGRLPRAITAAPSAGEVYVLDHAEPARPGDDGWRPTLRVLEASLALQRLVSLGEARPAPLSGTAQTDPSGTRVVVNDLGAARVLVVNPASGAVATTLLESAAAAVGFAAASGGLVAVMPQRGTAALLAPGGERIDTIAIGHALPADAVQAAAYGVFADAETGETFVANGAEATLVRLPRETSTAVVNLTDLWSDPAEPGWGLFVEHQAMTVFAALFAYGNAGEASWLMMSNGTRQADGSFSGVLFRTQGPVPVRSSGITPVGIMRIVPAADGSAQLTYVVDGASTTRRIERFTMGNAPRACRWTTSLEAVSVARANFTALWSNPADPGWGLAVSHRAEGVFAVLFTYDDENRPSWMVMSRGRQVAPGAFAGELYRVARGQVRSIGSLGLRFNAADEGMASWRMDGTEFRAPLLRQRFAPLVSRCGG